jgi:hypothetical protein
MRLVLARWHSALRELASRMREASDRYAWESDHEAGLDSDSMEEFALGWKGRAARLEDRLRGMDLLPKLPDPEREALTRALDHVAAWAAPEGKEGGLLDELLALEEGNRDAIRTVLDEDPAGSHLDADTRALLEDSTEFSYRVSDQLEGLRRSDARG